MSRERTSVSIFSHGNENEWPVHCKTHRTCSFVFNTCASFFPNLCTYWVTRVAAEEAMDFSNVASTAVPLSSPSSFPSGKGNMMGLLTIVSIPPFRVPLFLFLFFGSFFRFRTLTGWWELYRAQNDFQRTPLLSISNIYIYI